MANNPLDKVYLTEAQLQTLASGGSITSGSDTYTADEDTLYLTDDVPACLTGPSAPTTSTVGAVGQFFLDTTNSKLYQCTAITEDTSTTPSTFTYTWNEIGGGGLAVLTGSSNPTTSTVGELGQTYINTSENAIWQCVNINGSTYTWTNTGGAGNQTNGFLAAGASNSIRNSVAIGKNASAVGGTTSSTYGEQGSIAIGINANAQAGPASSGCSIAIGSQSAVRGSNWGIAIGYGATIENGAETSIQLGSGSNSTARTLKIVLDNVYNHYTHTATLKNIQQGVTTSTGAGGNPVYGIMSDISAPTTSTKGSVGQFYLDTATSKLYQCTAVTEDTSTTPSTFSYTWNEIGGGTITFVRWS